MVRHIGNISNGLIHQTTLEMDLTRFTSCMKIQMIVFFFSFLFQFMVVVFFSSIFPFFSPDVVLFSFLYRSVKHMHYDELSRTSFLSIVFMTWQ